MASKGCAWLLHQRDLTVVLALDMNGSMREGNTMAQAKHAADVFLKELHDNTDEGLVLFNDEVRKAIPPLGNRDPREQKTHREKIRQAKDEAEPRGGTGYLNATVKAVDMLRNTEGNKAVVLITNGFDSNKQPLAGQCYRGGKQGQRASLYDRCGSGQP